MPFIPLASHFPRLETEAKRQVYNCQFPVHIWSQHCMTPAFRLMHEGCGFVRLVPTYGTASVPFTAQQSAGSLSIDRSIPRYRFQKRSLAIHPKFSFELHMTEARKKNWLVAWLQDVDVCGEFSSTVDPKGVMHEDMLRMAR